MALLAGVVRGVVRAQFRWHPSQEATPLAQRRSVPLKLIGTDADGTRAEGHDLLARLCLIRSTRARLKSAAGARRIEGPRP